MAKGVDMHGGKVSMANADLEHALELHRRGQLAEAERAYLAILRRRAPPFEAAHGLGVLCLQRGLVERSEGYLRQAVGISPTNVAARHDLGVALQSLGRFADALEHFDRAIALAPENALAHFNRANALQRLERTTEALEAYERAIALKPDFALACYQRGNLLLLSARPEEALGEFDRAISASPDFPEAHNNRGNALRELDRVGEAIAAYRKVAALKPDHPLAHYNLGLALQDSGLFEEASASYNRAIFLKPDFHEAMQGRGTLELLTGRFRQGFADFEHRLALEDLPEHPGLRRISRWSGQDLSGKSIVVYSDGAFGDLVQFCRYLPLLVARNAQVTLLAPARLHRILAPDRLGISGLSELTDRDRFDFRCEIMSLPFAFGTEPDTIPPCVDHLFRDEARIAKWRATLPRDGFNIGICWQGNPARKIDRGRSIPLAEFAPLGRVPGVRLFSLQKGYGLEQLERLPEGMRVETFGPDFDSGDDAFQDTAAVMASIDLVVTSDTSVAHLAGALGRPAWVALRRIPEWRWLLDRADTPWYRTIRLFRQQVPDRWSPVFAEMAEALRARLAA